MISKCLFPAAGYGTRFLPLTKSMPKEMIPILNKPLIHYGVEEALAAGASEIAFVTGRGKRAIEDYFDYSYEIEKEVEGTQKAKLLDEIHYITDRCTFSYTRQTQIRGLGHAILSGETLIGGQPFAVILSDDLCEHQGKGVLAQMMDVYDRHRCCVVAIESVPIEKINMYGCVNGTKLEDRVLSVDTIIEKPKPDEAPSNLGVIGRYILTPDIFEILKNLEPGYGGEIQLTDALMEKASQGRLVAYQFRGTRFDCGSIEGFMSATEFYYRMHIKMANRLRASV